MPDNPKLNALAAHQDMNYRLSAKVFAASLVGFQGMAPVSEGGTKKTLAE